jgi:predicted DNA-binding transcriptional regulator YafY
MRADRLISILLLLQSHRRLTARELAKRLEVSERTILRDMEALSGSGVPVLAERGAGGGWSLLGDYQTRLTGLSPAEIQSLFLARPPRLMADLGIQRHAESALLKLEASLSDAARRQAEFARRRILIDTAGWRGAAELITCLPVLLDALWRERQVRFIYARELCEPSERTADPLGLVAKGSTWYLIARSEGQLRTYRVSRMSDAALLDGPTALPADFDLAEYWQRSAAEFREKLPRYYATFLAQPSVMRWVRYKGWRLESEEPEGDRVRVKLRFDVEEEALQFALSFGDGVEAIEPANLRDKVLERAEAAARLYGGGGAGALACQAAAGRLTRPPAPASGCTRAARAASAPRERS